MPLMRLPADTLASLRFLSRLPVATESDNALPDFQRQAHTFPLAGCLIGVLPALVASAASMAGLTPLVTAVATITTGIITTGALHEDGLADVADGFWGGYTRERKLEIMRDSAIGSYGTLALICSIALVAAAIAQVAASVTTGALAATIIAAAGLSRAAMLWPWVRLDNARPKQSAQTSGVKDEAGLSARFGLPDAGTLKLTALTALLPIALLFIAVGPAPTLLVIAVLILTTLAATALARHYIAGHTGDVLGATQQIAQVGFWLALAAATGTP